MENLNLFIRSVFIDNMIFAYFLGMCSYLAVSKNVKTAFGLGIAVTFMLVITLPIDYMLEMHFLRPGALTWLSPEFATVDLSFLSLILFIAVIASMTQLVEMAVEKFSPSLYASLGIFLPLIAVNCATLRCFVSTQNESKYPLKKLYRKSLPNVPSGNIKKLRFESFVSSDGKAVTSFFVSSIIFPFIFV